MCLKFEDVLKTLNIKKDEAYGMLRKVATAQENSEDVIEFFQKIKKDFNSTDFYAGWMAGILLSQEDKSMERFVEPSVPASVTDNHFWLAIAYADKMLQELVEMERRAESMAEDQRAHYYMEITGHIGVAIRELLSVFPEKIKQSILLVAATDSPQEFINQLMRMNKEEGCIGYG